MKRRILVVLLVAIPLATYWLLKVPLVDTFIARHLPGWAAAAGVELFVGAAEFDPWGPALRLTGVRARDPSGSWELTADSLQLRLRLLRSLGGTPHLDLEAVAPRFHGNFPGRRGQPDGEKQGGGGPPALIVETLRVERGSVEVGLPDLDLGLTLPGIEIAWVRNRGTAQVEGGSLRWAGGEEALEALSFQGERRFAAVRVDRLEVRTRHLTLAASGRVGPWRLVDLDLSARARLQDLPEGWVRALGLTRFSPVDTEVSVTAAVKGSTVDPRAAGMVQVAPGRLGPLTIVKAGARWEADRDGISFQDLEAQTSVGSVAEAVGRLGWASGLSLETSGRALDYDLRRFMVLLEGGAFPVGVKATGEFQAKGTLFPDLSLDCVATLQARDLDVTVGEPNEERTVFSLGEAAVSSQLNVGGRELTFGKTRIETPSVAVDIPSGRILYQEGLWFDTRVVLQNLDHVRQYLPPGLDAKGTATGRFGGPYRELKFAYDLDLASAVVFGEDWGRLRASARYDLRDLTLDGAEIKGPWGEGSAKGSVGLHPRGEYALQLQAVIPDLGAAQRTLRRSAPGVPEDLRGAVTAAGRLTGGLASPVFAGEVRADHPAAGGYGLDEITARGEASAERWRIAEGTARAYGARIEARGEGNLQMLHVSGSISGFEPGRLLADLGSQLPIAGVFSGNFEVDGEYWNPTAKLTGTADGLLVAGRPLGALAVTAGYRSHRLEAQAVASGGAARVQGELGVEGGFPFQAKVDLNRLPWSALAGEGIPADLVGDAISGHGQVSGALERPAQGLRASWAGTASGLRWRRLEVGDVPFDGQWDGEGLRASAEAWKGQAAARVRISPQPGASLEAGLDLERLPLARLRGLAPLPEGSVTAHARLVGALEELSRAQGLARLAALTDLEADGSVDGLVTAGGAALPRWSFRVTTSEGHPEVRLDSEGAALRFALDGSVPGHWRADGHFKEFAPTAWFPEEHALGRLRGAVTGAFSAKGVGTRVDEGSGEGQLAGLAWGAVVGPSDWTWSVAWAAGAGRASLSEPRGVKVTARWAPEQALVADLTLDNVPLEGWLIDPRVPADLAGSVSGGGQVQVGPDGEVTAEVALTDLRLRAPPATLTNDGPVQVVYQGGVIRVSRLQLVGEQAHLGVSGELQPGQRWDLKLAGSVDLGAVPRWVSAVRRSSGLARATLEIRGAWASPIITGPLTVEPGATLLLSAVDLPIQDLEASAHFDSGRGLIVEWIDAQVGQGRLHLEGIVGLEGFLPGKLRLLAEARNIAYESPPQVSYLADADLLLTGTVERPEIRGDVRLKEFLYGRRLNLKTLVLDALKRRPREVQGAPEAGTVFVDLAVRGTENLRVVNNLADLSLALDVRARGYLPRPVLWGQVEATGGTFRFRSQEYDMLRSSVEFLGEAQPVPLLDIHARTTQGQYTITLDISGPLDRYQVTMASLPPLPQNDIVALLTLGTTTEEATGAQGFTAAEAANFLVGGVQEEVEGGVGEIFGLDQFHIDPAYSPTTQTTVPRVTVGKAITRDLFARYSAAVGGETDQDLEVQYTLSPRILLLGTWTDRGAEAQGSLGGEVRFRYGFR